MPREFDFMTYVPEKWRGYRDAANAYPGTRPITKKRICVPLGSPKYRMIATVDYEASTITIECLYVREEYSRIAVNDES